MAENEKLAEMGMEAYVDENGKLQLKKKPKEEGEEEGSGGEDSEEGTTAWLKGMPGNVNNIM